MENADLYRDSLTSHGLRQGKLVNLYLRKDEDQFDGFHLPLSQIDKWRIVEHGIIVGMHEKSAFVRISSIGRNFVGTYLGSEKGKKGGGNIQVGLLAKSEVNIFEATEKSFKGCSNYGIGSAGTSIIKSIYSEEFKCLHQYSNGNQSVQRIEQPKLVDIEGKVICIYNVGHKSLNKAIGCKVESLDRKNIVEVVILF